MRYVLFLVLVIFFILVLVTTKGFSQQKSYTVFCDRIQTYDSIISKPSIFHITRDCVHVSHDGIDNTFDVVARVSDTTLQLFNHKAMDYCLLNYSLRSGGYLKFRNTSYDLLFRIVHVKTP